MDEFEENNYQFPPTTGSLLKIIYHLLLPIIAFDSHIKLYTIL